MLQPVAVFVCCCMQDLWDAPAWNTPANSINSTAQFTSWTQHGGRETRKSAYHWIDSLIAQHSKASRLWWYGVFMRQYFSPSAAMDAEAATFLTSNGLKPSDSFIVVHIRHGSKGIEQNLIQPEEFLEPIKRTLACLNTNHVYLVTETRKAAERMLELGQQHGFHVFTIRYNYTDADIWNTELCLNGIRSDCAASGSAAAAASMREISYVSAKALAVTRRGSAFIGTLQSAWAKVSVAAMWQHHGRPVPTWTLRWTRGMERAFVGPDEHYYARMSPTHLPWPCTPAEPTLSSTIPSSRVNNTFEARVGRSHHTASRHQPSHGPAVVSLK